MSRVSLIEQLYIKRKSALEFDFDKLCGPPVMSLFSPADIATLYNVATSLKYNGNIEKKYEIIDTVMKRRGFYKAHCGTNRAVYNFYEDTSFVVKVALDKVALKDSPAEFFNQQKLKPFCCKVFDVHPSGVISTVERVNPITSLEEFLSVAEDVFNMMITKIIGKYVVDDLGADKFMNYGLRQNTNGCTFGPVILDFPYVYELDGAKLICQKPIKSPYGEIPCNGEIDYDDSLSHLVCTKCGRTYKAIDLENKTKNVLLMYEDGGEYKMRTRIINRSNGKVIKDSGITSKTIMSKEEFDKLPVIDDSDDTTRIVVKKKFSKRTPLKQARESYYTSLQIAYHNQMEEERLKLSGTKDQRVVIKKSNATDNSGQPRAVITGLTKVSLDSEPIHDNTYPDSEKMVYNEESDTTESEQQTSDVESDTDKDMAEEINADVEAHNDYVNTKYGVDVTEEEGTMNEESEESDSEEEEIPDDEEDDDSEDTDTISDDPSNTGEITREKIVNGDVITEQTDLWQGYDYDRYMSSSGKGQRKQRRDNKQKYNKNSKYGKKGKGKNKGFDDYDDDDINDY